MLNNDIYQTVRGGNRGVGGLYPSRLGALTHQIGQKFTPAEDFLTQNCIFLLRKIPSFSVE